MIIVTGDGVFILAMRFGCEPNVSNSCGVGCSKVG